MKAFVRSNYPCRSSTRISNALERYAPDSVEIVTKEADADFVLIHVGGRRDHVLRHIVQLRLAGKRYAILQLVLRAGRYSKTGDWRQVWQGASFVWSYYDLAEEIRLDGGNAAGERFYHSPLGVDWFAFTDSVSSTSLKPYVVLMEGDNAKRESMLSIAGAARRVNRKVIHVGPDLGLPDNVLNVQNIGDSHLRWFYRQCDFASGLRTIEGFELVAAEGLLCGCRPLLYDRQHHRNWFGNLPEYIPETTASEATDALEFLFKQKVRQLSTEEYAEAKRRFNWQPICKGFWEHADA